jgi:hypothetical protein
MAEVDVVHGGPAGFDSTKDDANGWVASPYFNVLPNLQAWGDLNGDGYGDVTVALPDLSFASLGSIKSASTMLVLSSHEDPKLPPAALASGFDLDGDGTSDVVLASAGAASPIRVARGLPDRFDVPVGAPFGGELKALSRAVALAPGDFDGDGVADVAFSTIVDDRPAVCVYSAKSGALNEHSCFFGTGPAAGFGQSLAAGDLDGDGVDEIVVASSSGITVLSHKGPDFTGSESSFESEAISGSYGTRVTMIHPGLHTGPAGAARWATHSADGISLYVFSGRQIVQTIALIDDPYYSGFGVSIR